MASLQKKSDSWYLQFMYRHQRFTFTVGKVEEDEAHAVKGRVEYLLMRIKQHLLDIPAGMDICTFLQFDGKPPDTYREPQKKETNLAEFRDAYLKTFGNGAVEANTLSTARIHLTHLAGTLGEKFPMNSVTPNELQKHINRRQKDVGGVTIRKEIDTLRSAWKWASRTGLVEGDLPGEGLVFPKTEESLPFMTWKEIERRIKAGGDAAELWECLYLTHTEIELLLDFAAGLSGTPWFSAMLTFAAHTGARRSEIMRARVEDVNLPEGVVTIREKKRVKGKRSTRRVPLSSRLAALLTSWLTKHEGGPYLFGSGQNPLSAQAVQKGFVRMLKGSKWEALKGWHVLRHSFISALASRSIDQRMIDEFVGHQSESMRRRYRHLYPSTQAEALRAVFG